MKIKFLHLNHIPEFIPRFSEKWYNWENSKRTNWFIIKTNSKQQYSSTNLCKFQGINPIKAGLFRALHGWGGLRGPPPLLLIGKYLDRETWHTYRETYSVQIFVTIFLPMSAFFLWRHFPLKTQIFSKIYTQYQKSSYYGNFG